MQIHARKAERWRNQHGRSLAIGAKRFAVERKFRVKVARTPTVEHFSHCRLIDAEQIGEGLQIWSESDNRANVQIAICPAIEAVSDAGREGIVDGGMAQGALNADRAQRSLFIEVASDAEDRIQFQEG